MGAILIYERNTAISEALYGVLQGVEVALRNAIHREMCQGKGPEWLETLKFEKSQDDKINEAKEALRKDRREQTPGAMVAELSLGFWTSLTASVYEKKLWVPYIHKAFPNAKKQKRPGEAKNLHPISRAEIFEHLDKIRMIRNRIAHHEPILGYDLPRIYADSLMAIQWVCFTSANWVRSTNCFEKRFYEKPLSYASPKLPTIGARPMPGMAQPRT